MIVDCFTFFNEIGLLALRIEELHEEIDYFVIVEAGQTFAGRKKEFIFEKFNGDFHKIKNKLIYVKIEKLPPIISDNENSRFWLEAYQRNAIFTGLAQINLGHDDIVLISDVDEIPSRPAIQQLKAMNFEKDAVAFKQALYYSNIESMPKEESWIGTIAIKYKLLGCGMPHEIRTCVRENREYTIDYIESAGWHLSYFGDSGAVKYKTANFSHGASDSIEKYDQSAESALNHGGVSKLKPVKYHYKKIHEIFSSVDYNIPIGMLNSPTKYINYIMKQPQG